MKRNLRDKDLQLIIGNIMRWGVIVSLSMAGIGGLIFVLHHGHEFMRYSRFTEKDNSIQKILTTTATGMFTGSGRAFIMAGILLLFVTPLVRVIFSLFGFIIEKDKTYIIITLIVLSIIGISISGGLH